MMNYAPTLDKALTSAGPTLSPAAGLQVAVICNPHSGRNRRRGLAALRQVVGQRAAYWETPNLAAFHSALRISRESDLVVLNGGDGTVQTALSYWAMQGRWPPLLAVIGGGTTNMTAADLGVRGEPAAAVGRILDWAESPRVEALCLRPVVCVQSSQGKIRAGLFFGTGAILAGIAYCREQLHSRGIASEIGPGLATLRVLWGILRRDPRFSRATPGLVQHDGSPLVEQDWLLVVASTLERLFLGLKPFWGGEGDGLAWTAVASDARRPLLTLPPLLWGRPGAYATPGNGYHSQRSSSLSLDLSGGYTLDGEFFHDPGPWELAPSPILTFVQP